MKKTLLSSLLLLSAAAMPVEAAVDPIVLTSPDDYQVLSVSPNGKWAAGVYVDYGGNGFGFLWNLESNSVQLLSTTYGSYANSVSNDGTVAGHFVYQKPGGGVASEVPGWYKDGAWHPVEMPVNSSVGDTGSTGHGSGITPDGTRMSGTVYIDKSYVPYVWSITDNGAIVKQLDISNPEGTVQHGIPNCMSPNGTMAGGWAYRYNRANVLWDVNTGEKQYVGLTDHAHQGFNAAVQKFSPDGKKVIFSGCWDTSVSASASTQWAYSIYDLETGDITLLPSVGGSETTVALYGISSDYTVVGANNDFDGGRAVIYKTANATPDGRPGLYKANDAMYLDTYLTQQGVNFSKYSLYNARLFRGQDISADGNVICALYYANVGGAGVLRSMIVKLNQDISHSAPQEVVLRQITGINTVEVTWKRPIIATEGIKEFAIYRDGTKVATVDNTCERYFDKDVAEGRHSYYITSVYDDEETKSSEFSVNVTTLQPQQVQNLFVRQRGINNIYAEWDAPMSNLINKNWYNASTANLQDFGIGVGGYTIEMGVGFDKEEMELYKDCKIKKVAFYPMEQHSFTINIYDYDEHGKLHRIHTQPVTQPLTLKERNIVDLTEAVSVPTGSKVVVALSTHMNVGGAVLGMDYGRYNAGYSDLIRFSDEPDFYSYYDLRAQQGYPDFITLMIDLVLEKEGTDLSADVIDHYEVATSDKDAVSTTERSMIIPNAVVTTAAANRTVSVKTVYANGVTSDAAQAIISVKPAFKGVESADVKAVSETAVKVSWDTPMDIDTYEMTLSGNTPGVTRQTGIKGPASNNYGYMAGALYPEKMVKGYKGYEVKKFRFYPLGDATFTFMLLENDKQVAEVPVFDYVPGQWNEVVLDEPVIIKDKTSYSLVLDVYDAEPQVSVLAIDNMVPYSGSGDVYSLDASPEQATWTSIGVNGMRGNWMIGMVVEEPDPQPARISGYDLYISTPGTINVRKVNTSMITDTEYTHDFSQPVEGSGKLRVASYYEGRATVASTGTVCDYSVAYDNNDMDGIKDIATDALKGNAVIYDALGRRVRTPKHGIYIMPGKNGNGNTNAKLHF